MKRKVIRLTLTLAGQDEKTGKYETFTSEGNYNQARATGLRVQANILYGYGAIMPTAQIRVYGLSMDKMMKLLRVRWNTMNTLLNRVKIEAGDEGEKLATVFEGNITFAYPDFANAPDVSLVIESITGILEHAKPARPSAYKGQVDVADIVKDIVDDMGYQLENNGVSKIVENWTLTDTNVAKLRVLASGCGFDLYIDNGLVAITPKDGARNVQVPVIKPTSGMLGYPVPDLRGVSFKCLHDPLIRFGGIVKIRESLIEVCNGDWRIYGLRKSLEANQPNGNWFCEVSATWKDSNDAAIAK